mmetsp:Transcript_18929/g.31620  ORF Transcript_18929/g.31620 Transcript_18929/m.31620 type:complete len:542 (+) Transcript_18929:99-1724(+)
MDDDGGNTKRHRAGSISGRLRTASDLEQCGLIDNNQKGVLKDMIISGDSTLQGALEKYEQGDPSELESIIKSGTLADRRSSIDLLDGLDLDFLGNALGDSFDGFEFDASANQLDEGDKFRYRSESSVVDQDLLEERNPHTGERVPPHGGPSITASGTAGSDHLLDAMQILPPKETEMPPSSGPLKSSGATSETSQGNAASTHPTVSVGYDPLFSSGITYEEQRLRAGSFHTDQQRARANSLMMDQQAQMRPAGDAWQRNPPYFNHGTAGGGGYQPPFPPDGVDMYGTGGDMYGMGGHGGVGSFGASPDIDYGMGIYEQRLRGNSFQQVNDQRLRAGSFQLYPPQPPQQQNASRGMMPPPGRSGYFGGSSVPPSSQATSSGGIGGGGAMSGDKRMHQVESKHMGAQQQPHPLGQGGMPQSQHSHLSSMYQTSQPHSQATYTGAGGASGMGGGRVDATTGESMAGYVGTYSPEARKERINRFNEKRKNRVWTKKVKYDVRKNFADSRIRVKGRFVKKEDEEKMRLQLGEEEWARVVAKSQGLA